jgi:ribosome-associated toxin RatA of RatAB toxin-antitoxin module
MWISLVLSVLAQAPAQDALTPLLDRGPLVLVEQTKDGKFQMATGIVQVDAPPQLVWETLLKMEDYKNFMPKVELSEISNRDEAKGEFDVHYIIEVPGPDTDYTIRFVRNDKEMTLTGKWIKGDLKGSRWFWKVQPGPGGKTLLSQSVQVKNFSALLQNVEDDQQTITLGINVGSAVVVTGSLKRHIETRLAASKGAAAVPGAAAK